MKSGTKITAIALGVVIVASLAGCAPGSSGATTSGTSESPSKDLGSAKISLSVVTTPESGAPMKEIIAKFEKIHPNVTVSVQKTTFDDYNKGLALSLASNSSPDIALLNLVGNMPKNKLILPLTGYEKLYNWDSTIPSNVMAQWKVTKDFTGLGGDTLYGLPTSLTLVGLFYNKKLASQAGISGVPATIDEWQADLEKAKAAAVLPLQLGNSQGHASFLIQGIGQSVDGADAANTWALGKSGATFDTAGNREGVKKLDDWTKAGYIPSTANGVDLQGAVGKFTQGEGVYFNDGNWDAGNIDKAMGDNVGFFAMPGKKATAIGGSIAYGISAKSKHPNAAAAFLNFVLSDAAAPAQFNAGFLPVNVSAVTPKTSLETDIVKQYSRVNDDNGIVSFNNNVTASMNDTLIAQTQELIGGKTSEASLIQAIQADWAKSHG